MKPINSFVRRSIVSYSRSYKHSRTIPNQAYSLREIVTRFAHGEMLPIDRSASCKYDYPSTDPEQWSEDEIPFNPLNKDVTEIEDEITRQRVRAAKSLKRKKVEAVTDPKPSEEVDPTPSE